MKLHPFPLILVVLLTTNGGLAEEPRGQIAGKVVDAATQQPLVGVNIVVVEEPSLGAATDASGNFRISNIAAGKYSLRTSMIGYTPAVVTDVIVSTGRTTLIRIQLAEAPVQLEGVEVRADYFSKAAAIGAVSTHGLNSREIRLSPGAAEDMHRVMQILPGIGNSNDQNNELIVRGGAPNENLTVLDHIEIPSTNHYPNQFNSGGGISMVNVDLIEDIQFSAGGFPAQYGDKLSSVMHVTLREGDRQRTFATNTGIHFAGFQSVMEGGFAGGRGSWLLSARKSFLEIMDNIVGISTFGVTAIPEYWDAQAKIVYDLSDRHKLMVNGIYGDSKILLRGKPKERLEPKAGVTDSTAIETVDFNSRQYAYGMTLRSLWGARAYSLLSLSVVGHRYAIETVSNFTERYYDASGKLLHYRTLNSLPAFSNQSLESMIGLKFDLTTQPSPSHEVSFGFQLQTPAIIRYRTGWLPDTARYDVDGDGTYETGPVTFPRADIRSELKIGDLYRAGAYAQDRMRIWRSLTATVGLRYDYFSYARQANVSPRLSLSYELLPAVTRLNAAYGEYYQTQSFPLYHDHRNLGVNRYLKNSRARHSVLGVEHILGEGLKVSVEAYRKSYRDLPVREDFVYSAIDTFRSDRYLSIGRRHSTGVEFFLQQKRVKDVYGTISYSYSRTMEEDARIPPLVRSHPSQYDYPHILTVVLGSTVKGARSSLTTLPDPLRSVLRLLPISDDMEVSMRFRYQSGNPYTPRLWTAKKQLRIGGATWSEGAWVESTEINSARHRPYHRLDVQWIGRYHFSNWNIVAVLLLENVYNRANIWGLNYFSDGTVEPLYQFSFFPVLGIGIEF